MIAASTTSGDQIVIIAFATILVLVATGVFAAMKWLIRILLRKPRPLAPQSFGVVFEMAETWKQDADEEAEFQETENEEVREMQRFSAYLESRLQSEQLGEFDIGEVAGRRVSLFFFGPDANRIWQRIEWDIRTYSPTRPLEVRLDYGKKRGGKVIQNIASDAPHHPLPIPDFERWDPQVMVSPLWKWMQMIGSCSALLGFLGLFLNSLGRKVAGISEQENMRSGFDSFVMFGLSGMFIIGMILCLISVCYIHRDSQRPNCGPLGRELQGLLLPRWISNKLILIIIAGVITTVLLVLRME